MGRFNLQRNFLIAILLATIMIYSACKDNDDPEPEGLNAAFSAIPFEGHSPLAVEFKDESTGSPTSWKWDLQGDGAFDEFTSNPYYTYIEPGSYDVKLVVSNGNASDSLTILDYIYLNRDDVQLNYEGTLSPNVGGSHEIPLKIGLDVEFGAMTMKLLYDNRILEVTSIEGDMGGFVDNIDHENGSVSIAWSSVTPFIVKQNETLFTISATILTGIDPVTHYIRIGDGTEFADPQANILQDIELLVPFIDAPE
jgi:PKD repeat protein